MKPYIANFQALVDWSCTLMCLHKMAIRLVQGRCHAAGNQNGTQSTSNSSRLWTGSVSLEDGYHNLTVEYHNGNGQGALIVLAGYNTTGPKAVSVT